VIRAWICTQVRRQCCGPSSAWRMQPTLASCLLLRQCGVKITLEAATDCRTREASDLMDRLQAAPSGPPPVPVRMRTAAYRALRASIRRYPSVRESFACRSWRHPYCRIATILPSESHDHIAPRCAGCPKRRVRSCAGVQGVRWSGVERRVRLMRSKSHNAKCALCTPYTHDCD